MTDPPDPSAVVSRAAAALGMPRERVTAFVQVSPSVEVRAFVRVKTGDWRGPWKWVRAESLGWKGDN